MCTALYAGEHHSDSMATKHNQKYSYLFFFISIGAEQPIPDYVGSP